MQESQLYALWQALGRSGRWVTDGRHRLRVLDAGTLNLALGPDFSGACFDLDGTRFYGDVEMHVRQSDWYRHHHHVNPLYRNVALHVVLTPLQKSASVHSEVTRRNIPSFFLNLNDWSSAVAHPAMRCEPPDVLPASTIERLQELALRRFRAKMRAFLRQSDGMTLSAIFYKAFMRALGYPANTQAFELLAQRVPFEWLNERFYHPFLAFDTLYALYAGQAGFLETSSSDVFTERLNNLYEASRPLLSQANLPATYWRYSGIRAVNHPHFRLAGWVALYLKARGQPFVRLSALVARRLPYAELLTELEAFFQIPTEGYWRCHYRLASPPVKGARHYFGRARIFEILSNVLLPLLAMQALKRTSEGFYDYLENFYLYMPTVTRYQSVGRNFPWWERYEQLWPRHVFWQALLQLDAEFCQAEACAQCPLGHRLDK